MYILILICTFRLNIISSTNMIVVFYIYSMVVRNTMSNISFSTKESECKK